MRARAGVNGGGRTTAALADDRAAHAQGLDRPQGGRRPAGGGLLPLPSGAACRPARQARAPRPARAVAALLPPRGAVRRGRRAAWRVAQLAPQGERRMGANPHANGGLLLRALELPDFRQYAVEVSRPGTGATEATRVLGGFLREVIKRNPDSFRIMGPDETASNRLGAVFDATDRVWESRDAPERRPSRARRPRHGGPLRAPLPGLAGGLPADRPPRAVQLLRGVHPHRRLDVQPARQVAEGHPRHSLAGADRVAELPALLARVAPGPQRLLPPGPRLHRPRGQQEGRDRARVPPAGRQLPAVGRRPLPAQPRLRQRDRRRQAACARLPGDGRGDRSLHARDRRSGTGPATTRAQSPTSCWRAQATCRRSRRSRPRRSCDASCPI